MTKTVRLLALILMASAVLVGCKSNHTGVVDKTADIDFHENQLAVVVSDGEGKPGDTVSMTVSIVHNPSIAGFSFCVKIPDGCRIENEKIAMEDNTYSYCNRLTEENAVNFAWTNLSQSADDRVIARFDLKLDDSIAPGEYPVQLLFRDRYDVFYTVADDQSMPEYEVIPFDGVLTVK